MWVGWCRRWDASWGGFSGCFEIFSLPGLETEAHGVVPSVGRDGKAAKRVFSPLCAGDWACWPCPIALQSTPGSCGISLAGLNPLPKRLPAPDKGSPGRLARRLRRRATRETLVFLPSDRRVTQVRSGAYGATALCGSSLTGLAAWELARRRERARAGRGERTRTWKSASQGVPWG